MQIHYGEGALPQIATRLLVGNAIDSLVLFRLPVQHRDCLRVLTVSSPNITVTLLLSGLSNCSCNAKRRAWWYSSSLVLLLSLILADGW